MNLFDSKFFQIIQTFSPTELKSFELWLKSPWANSNKNLIRLLEKVQKHHPNFDYPKLTKPKLFQQILPKGKYSDRRMNNLLSEGYLAAERFMVFNSLANNQNLQKDLLTQELQNRHLEDWFFRDINKEVERLEEKEIKDWEDHLGLLRLNRRIYHHPNQNPRMQPGGQTIVKMGEQLDLVFLLEKAAIINEKIFRNRILKNENHEIEKELKIWLAASEGVEHLAVELYRLRFGYSKELNIGKYYKIRTLFFNRYYEINKKEQQVHQISLMNDTSVLKRKGLLESIDVLKIYKFGFQTKILPINRTLLPITFAAVLSMSNAEEDFDFSKKIIDEYSSYLPKEIRNEAINWANSHLAYRKGNLEQSLTILLQYKFKDIFFITISKVLNLQVYFDLYLIDHSYFEYLNSYCNAFERWIGREKFNSQLKKDSYRKFIQKSRELIKLNSDSYSNKDKLQNFLLNEANVEARSWLIQKRNQILNSQKLGVERYS